MTSMTLSEFADTLIMTFPIVMREMFKRQRDEIMKGEITLPQLLILEILMQQGKTKMKDLASLLNVTTAAVTGIIDRLVRCGYVLRKSDTNDRRIIYVAATQKGLTMTKKIMSQRRQLIMQVFSKISQEDRSRYLDILTRVKDLLVQERTVSKAHA